MTSGDRFLAAIGPDPLVESELVSFVTTPASGGVVLFSGVVRDRHEGREVVGIEYVAARDLARTKLEEVCREALRGSGVHRVAAVHRVGRLEVGEASVVVAASAVHRADAFRVARHLIDRIKEVVPVWKHEHFADGTTEWAPGHAVAEADRSARAVKAAGS